MEGARLAGTLRVIAGSAGGRLIRRPSGSTTRPTSGRLREALFAMLEAMQADFSHVIDLYAGSGALGIEALSRGAEACTFVERDPRAVSVIEENLRSLDFSEHAEVVRGRVGRWRPAPDSTYTLVVADPPYDDAAAWTDIERSVQGVLAPGATLAVEHAARVAPPSTLAGLELWRDRRQGEGAVAIYRAHESVSGEDR